MLSSLHKILCRVEEGSVFLDVVARYSFAGGMEALQERHPYLLGEVESVIRQVDIDTMRLKESREKTMPGKMLYSPSHINAFLKVQLDALGWQPYGRNFTAPKIDGTLPHTGRRTMDGFKNRVGLEIQFGKYSFMPYDVLTKFVIFRNLGLIDYGIEVVGIHAMTAEMSTGIGHFEQLVTDLHFRKSGDDEVPVAVLGIGIPGMPISPAAKATIEAEEARPQTLDEELLEE